MLHLNIILIPMNELVHKQTFNLSNMPLTFAWSSFWQIYNEISIMHIYNDVKHETCKTEDNFLSDFLKYSGLCILSHKRKKGKMILRGRNLNSTLDNS